VLPEGQKLEFLRDLHEYVQQIPQPRPLVFDVILRMIKSARSNEQVDDAARLFRMALASSASAPSVKHFII
jgi:hypothetical protein